jgi:hypothetical protein
VRIKKPDPECGRLWGAMVCGCATLRPLGLGASSRQISGMPTLPQRRPLSVYLDNTSIC